MVLSFLGGYSGLEVNHHNSKLARVLTQNGADLTVWVEGREYCGEDYSLTPIDNISMVLQWTIDDNQMLLVGGSYHLDQVI